MNKKTVFGLTLLISMTLLLSGCSNAFTPTEVEKGSVWEAKKIPITPSLDDLTEIPFTKKIGGEDITIKKAFFCFHSDGHVYQKLIGTGKLIFGDKAEVIRNTGSYTINKVDKKIVMYGTAISYTLEGGVLTLKRDGKIFGIYKRSSEPEFTD